MRSAWNVRLAGLPPVRRAGAGMVSRMSSTSRGLVVNGSRSRSRTIARASGSGELLLAVGAQDPGEVAHRIGVEHLGRGDPLGLVHPHVQDGVLGVGEAAVGDVELHRRDAEVEQDRVDPPVPQAPDRLGQLVVDAVDAAEPLAERGQPGASPGQRLGVAVQADDDQLAGGPPASPRCGHRGRGWHRPPRHPAGSARGRAAPGSARAGRAHAPVPGSPGNHELVEQVQRGGRAQHGRG